MILASSILSSETSGQSHAFLIIRAIRAICSIPLPHLRIRAFRSFSHYEAIPFLTRLATRYSCSPAINHQPQTTKHPRVAFTLIELLMVVMVIAILFSILLSAIRTVERHTLQTVTQAEIKTIETAWKQYFAHYQMWPTNSMPDNLLGEDLALLLRGHPDSDQNPDQIIFMEFTRFADHEGKQIPVNAWGESGRHKPEDCAYYVMFDHEGINELNVEPGHGHTKTNLFRSVAVWSFNPSQTEKDSDKPKLLGSWMQ